MKNNFYQLNKLLVIALFIVGLPALVFISQINNAVAHSDGDPIPDIDITATERVEATNSVDVSGRDADSCPANTPIHCPDGSCAADTGSCPNPNDTQTDSATPIRVQADVDADGVPDFRDLDSDGDGLLDRAQNHNSSRSNETEGRLAPTSGGSGDDGIDIDNGEVPPAQDYNSTRSNRRKNVFIDSDGDGWPEVTMRAGMFIKIDGVEGESRRESSNGEEATAATSEDDADGNVFCWGHGEAADGRTFNWGRGLCLALEKTEGASPTAGERIAAIQARGEEVRGWSEEQRQNWEEFKALPVNSNDRRQQLAAHLIERVQTDEQIQEMRADDEGVDMRYRAEMRFLGLLPIHRDIAARASIEGEAVIEYPWYSFLFSKPNSERIRSLLSETIQILK